MDAEASGAYARPRMMNATSVAIDDVDQTRGGTDDRRDEGVLSRFLNFIYICSINKYFHVYLLSF